MQKGRQLNAMQVSLVVINQKREKRGFAMILSFTK